MVIAFQLKPCQSIYHHFAKLPRSQQASVRLLKLFKLLGWGASFSVILGVAEQKRANCVPEISIRVIHGSIIMPKYNINFAG